MASRHAHLSASHASSSSSSSSSLQPSELPAAREHSYLPSASMQILAPATDRASVTSMAPSTTNYQKFGEPQAYRPRYRSLAVMSMDFVLFPGDTLPIRLQERPWIHYLREQIAATTAAESSTSTLTPARAVQFGVLCGNNRPDPDHQMRQRRSWMRQAWGPRRLSEMSSRLLREMFGGGPDNGRGVLEATNDVHADGDDDDEHSEDGTETPNNGPPVPTPGRSLRESPENYDSDHDTRSEMEEDQDVGRMEDEDNDIVDSNGSGTDYPDDEASSMHSQASGDSSPAGEAGIPVALATSARADPGVSSRRNESDQDGEPFRGRVGTIASVLYTHAGATGDDGEELIVTAVGTSRFRIVSSLDDQETGRPSFMLTTRPLRHFLVEELDEANTLLPSCSLKCSSQVQLLPKRSSLGLAAVTPLPPYLYWKYDSIRLMNSIINGLEQTPSLRGVFQSLPEDGARSLSLTTPTEFAYWLASNLPLTRRQKLDILETESALVRLQLISQKVKQQRDYLIYCKRCDVCLTKARHIFTVNGADGTTGNYVNQHGFVHQTTTVRLLDENEVRLVGPLSFRDSWFPGYGYFIMSCGFCSAHLGWKFSLVRGEKPTADRPKEFYGLTATAITMH